MMVEWFEAENFKSIRKLHLDFNPLMVFVGPNGAGKTNIVQSLCLLLDIVAEGTTEPVQLYGGYEQLIRRRKQAARKGIRLALRSAMDLRYLPIIRGKGRYEPLTVQLDIVLKSSADSALPEIYREEVVIEQANEAPFRYCFVGEELEDFEVGSSGTVKELLDYWFKDLTKEKMLDRSRNYESTNLKLSHLFPFRMSRSLPGALRFRFDATSLRSDSPVGPGRHLRPFGLSGEGLPLAIEKMAKKGSPDRERFDEILTKLRGVYPRIEDVSTVHYQPGRVALSFKEKKIDSKLGESGVSDGVIHALALLVALYRSTSSDLLIIEEPENALHPWALHRIMSDWQLGVKKSEPLLLTTHSPVLVNAIKNPDSLFIVENGEDKGTMVFPARDKEHALTSIMAESGQKLGDLWLDGTLGGVPGAEN